MKQPSVQLLLVEDDEEDAFLTQRLLRDNGRVTFDVEWVRNYDAALEALRTPYSVCLVDYHLGIHNGSALIAQAIANGFHGPMILLTGRGDHDVDVEAMKAGAADYLVKDQITPQLLERVIRHAIERKDAEAALRRSEEQLRQSQKMEAVGSLAGGVAHDFNNLLSVILSYSELLATELKPGDPMRDDLNSIRDAGLRAAVLTRQLLAFSRQQVLQLRVVNLNDVFTGMERMLKRVIGEHLELRSVCAPNLPDILADLGQMEQVLMNLVVNARDAMPRGGSLTIATKVVTLTEHEALQHEGASAGPHVMLTVTDTGSGMDKATQARIFEPFFTTKEPGKGTGLGLSTVFGIVRQSGGSITVSSQPGEGTTFVVYFRTADRKAVASASTPPPELSTLRGSETILLVEDDQRVRALVHTILRKYGYTVLEAQSGGDALLLCEQHEGHIDLLLTDVVMPRMSGLALAERLAPLRPTMQVLFMSGYTDDEVVRHGVLWATIDFIQKPITPEPLARQVREMLQGARQRQGTAATVRS